MNANSPSPAPLSPRPLRAAAGARDQVMTARQLREHGIAAADAAQRCRPGGPWQQLLPGVYLLHAGPPTSAERLHAALLYAGRAPGRATVPGQTRGPAASAPAQDAAPAPYGDAMVTGLAALTLHGFASAPPLPALDRIDVLLPRTRRLRSTGPVRLVRAHTLPRPDRITGLPVAPVPRALADTVAVLTDAADVRLLLTEAVRGGHCEAAAVVRELSRARLLNRAHVIDAVDTLIAEGRALAEGRLYTMVDAHALPDPLWNVDLRLPGGPHLGGVDAYWPDHAVAVEIDARTPHRTSHDEEALWSQYARKRETLERLGITVVHVTPRGLREAPEQQAEVVRAAMIASAERDHATHVVVLPR
ncbi:hypothetical protein [Streptomyces sp. CMB-StM0423]|uniref:hypothetical protein n=1 Tax=Streptomyces sp. CMB-StM0423 TaxID=2059884 RepID=UPI000C7059C5|nr:hypothetical protein [Streptomyces sp. CMB-StM0423]AUH42992.1 hypothetical protein CXR04_24945 [Streptomyces sp. CMB-StM0423]